MADLGSVGQQGLLTKRTYPLYLDFAWDNNGAQQGLLTKRTALYLDLAWDNNGGQQGLLTKRSFTFPPQPPPVQPEAPPPSVFILNPNACPQKIDCECPELPLENLSSEDPDRPVFCATVTQVEDTPLGTCADTISCTKICCSEESQEEAYLCALRLAQNCIFGTWGSGQCAPPPEPEPNCPPACPPNPCPPCAPFCPPDCPPPPPFAPTFPNTAQSCEVQCPDGTTFFWIVPAGTLVANSLHFANFQAHALACKLARQKKICFITDSELEDGCEDEQYLVQIQARGGRPFIVPFIDQDTAFIPDECIHESLPNGTVVPYNYEVILGILPPGLTLNCFGWLRGTPTTAGDYSFTIRINDANGITQEKSFSIHVDSCTGTNFGSITPDIQSATRTYWESADPIPPGTYRISYLNGAWSSPGPVWLVGDGVLAGGKARGFYVVYNNDAAEVAFPTSGLYASQAAAEAGTSGKFIDIVHTGGRIGMYLHDLPYFDNGHGSPDPTFNLDAL